MCSGLPNWLQGPIDWVQSILPWGEHPAQPIEEDTSSDAMKAGEEAPAPVEQESAQEVSPSIPEPLPLEPAKNLEHGITLLKAEQCKRLEVKASELNAKVKAVHGKIKNIDVLLSLISQYSQKNPDGTDNKAGTIDCTQPEIASVIVALRRDGISVPLPDGILQKAERGHVVNVLSNQRSLLSDEQKEHSQEFQQCAVERNSLYQALMTLIAELHRAKSKILGNVQRSTAA